MAQPIKTLELHYPMIQLIWSNLDFNTNKTKQYEVVRKAMARKYSSGDADLLGPKEITAILEDDKETLRKELVEKVKSYKALIKTRFSRVMENIKELQQKFSNVMKMGKASGNLEMGLYHVMIKIWEGLPSKEHLGFGVQSSVYHMIMNNKAEKPLQTSREV